MNYGLHPAFLTTTPADNAGEPTARVNGDGRETAWINWQWGSQVRKPDGFSIES